MAGLLSLKDYQPPPVVQLAWSMLIASPRRLFFVCVGLAISAALMQYQTSLIYGFLEAAAAPIRGLGASVWLLPKGQPALEFALPLPRAYEALVQGVPGIRSVSRVANAFASYKGPNGQPLSISLVGVDLLAFDADLETTGKQTLRTNGLRSAIAFDARDQGVLGSISAKPEIEINGQRFVITDTVHGYATFLGTPYAFTDFDSARRALGLSVDQSNAIVVFCERASDVSETKRLLEERFPELTVITSAEFQRRSSLFWLIHTGAGGGLVLSAALGFFIGFIIISQTLFSTTFEHLKEFGTLRAIGIAPRDLAFMLFIQAVVLGLIGALLGTVLALLMVWATTIFILGWIKMTWWIPPLIILVCVVMSFAASMSSLRILMRVQPADAFRQA
jgi:putative ABC transport system permease protein